MSGLIQPRTLKGFRDYLPEVMMPRERIMEIARRVYRSYGFSPIDTPVLEYLEILTGKGSDETDRQLYRFEDHGGRQVGMRFDLTVPLARFVAQHIGQLGTPFKRYHIAPVWRGESPQAGRYREFVQCDFDTIGTESVVADIETGLVIHELLLAIGIKGFSIRINNRQVLNGVLAKLGLSEKIVPVLRSLDKLGKIGRDAVAAEMQQTAGVTSDQAQQVLQLAAVTGSVDEILTQLDPLVAGNELGEGGVDRLRQITRAPCKPPESRLLAFSWMYRLPAVWTITPASFLRLCSTIFLRSAVFAPVAATIIWRRSTPNNICPASARRLVSIVCWPPWKHCSSSPRSAHQPRYWSLSLTKIGCRTICNSHKSFAVRALEWSFTRNRKS